MSNKLCAVPINTIKEDINNCLKQIEKEYFIPFFESMKGCYSDGFCNKCKPAVRVQRISKIEDLENIPNQRGLYLIFTDYQSGFDAENKCEAVINNNRKAKAIYRGESYNVRTRLESHLFNKTYHQKLESDSNRSDRYTVCLKVDGEHVNLDKSSEMSKAKWYVAYHGFPKSNRVIREIAERAFDQVFQKPIFSKS